MRADLAEPRRRGEEGDSGRIEARPPRREVDVPGVTRHVAVRELRGDRRGVQYRGLQRRGRPRCARPSHPARAELTCENADYARDRWHEMHMSVTIPGKSGHAPGPSALD